MKLILLLPLLICIVGCETPTRHSDNGRSAIPTESQSRLPPGTVNTTHNTGNNPAVLSPRNLSDR